MSTIKPIPDTSSPLIPMLVCRNVPAQIEFCKTALGAVELGRRAGPDGAAVHALMTISGAMVIIEAEWPTLASRAPRPDGSSPVVMYVYVEDVDAVVARAVTAGAKVLLEVKNQFWGDRSGRILDPPDTSGPLQPASKRRRRPNGSSVGRRLRRVDRAG